MCGRGVGEGGTRCGWGGVHIEGRGAGGQLSVAWGRRGTMRRTRAANTAPRGVHLGIPAFVAIATVAGAVADAIVAARTVAVIHSAMGHALLGQLDATRPLASFISLGASGPIQLSATAAAHRRRRSRHRD